LFTALLLEWLVRHTPAFGHPSPRGDGLPHRFDYQWSAVAPSPLGEGCTKCGVCRIVKLVIRWIRSIRGSLIGGRCAQNLKKIFFKIIQIYFIFEWILADFEVARPTHSAGQAILSQRIDMVLKKCRFALQCCEKLLSLHILCCLAGKDNMLSK
jgi:hypothetical protein